MPILLLTLVALVGGALIALGFDRLVPPEGATTAAVVAMVIGGGLVVGLLAYLTRGNATLATIDSSVAEWGNAHATALSTRLLTWVTDLGAWPVVPLIGLPILAYEWRRSPGRSIVLFVVLVYAGDKLVTNGIKDLVDRARPTLNPVAETLGPSFPSGHSSTAASFYAALALILARGRSSRVRALLAGAAGALAIAVASSRVLLDLHWLSDVVAGVMLGWAWFALCAIAFGARRLHFAACDTPEQSADRLTPPERLREARGHLSNPAGPHSARLRRPGLGAGFHAGSGVNNG